MKNFLSVLLLVLMSLPAMAKTAAMMQDEVAAGGGSCGEKVTWKYDTASTTLTISGEGDMTNYETPDDLPWAAYMPYITTLVIGEDISSLSDYAFYWCAALVKVIVNAGYPPLCGSFAFYNIGPDATLTVPAGRKAYYEKSFGWKKFGNNIEEKALETSGSCGKNATWAYDAATKTLTITGTGEMKNYKYQGYAPWTAYGSEIEQVYIADGITSIGNNAFSHYLSLRSVRLPSSLEMIGESAFETCRELESIVIPQHVTSIGGYAFYSCINLESITLLPVSPPALGYASFDQISKKAIFTVADDNLVAYQKNKYWIMFFPSSDCGENATWTYDAATKTLTVTGTGRMYDCESAAAWDKYVENIGKIVIGEGITHIGNFAFSLCVRLTSVTLPSTLESIGEDAFSVCEFLSSVTIPANVKEIQECAFDGCLSLATITVEAVTPPVLGKNAFQDIDPDAQFIVPAGSEAAYRADENWKVFFKDDETGISSIEAAKGKVKVKKVFKNGKLCIGDYTIAGRRALLKR